VVWCPEARRGAPATRSLQWLSQYPYFLTMDAELKIRLRSPFLLDQMQPRAVLFFHLFCRMNSAAKVCELPKFLLDGL
jgi:hypothetical protein